MPVQVSSEKPTPGIVSLSIRIVSRGPGQEVTPMTIGIENDPYPGFDAMLDADPVSWNGDAKMVQRQMKCAV